MVAGRNHSSRLKRGFTICFLLVLTISGLAACSGEPDVLDARKIIETKIAEQAKGRVKLVGFEKSNGMKSRFGGMELYNLTYQATFEFPQEAWKNCDPSRGCFSDFYFRKQAPNDREAAVFSIRHFEAGSKLKVSGSMTFQKTENGWQQAN